MKYKGARNGGSPSSDTLDGRQAKKQKMMQESSAATTSRPLFSFSVSQPEQTTQETTQETSAAATSKPAFSFTNLQPQQSAEGEVPVITTTASKPLNAFNPAPTDPALSANVGAGPSASGSPPQQQDPQEQNVWEALAALAKIGYTVTPEDLAKLAHVDEFENEMRVMAEVRGYFQVAYKVIFSFFLLLSFF